MVKVNYNKMLKNTQYILLALLFTQSVNAEKFSYDQLKSKFEVEDSYQKQLEKIISTRLDEKTFKVGVQVTMREIKVKSKKATKREPAKKKSFYPQDLSMGIIDINNILDSYENDLKDLEARLQAQNNVVRAGPEEKKYKVRSIKILVGLHKQYGEDYFKNFSNWLRPYVKKTIGPMASASVEYIKEAPLEKKKEEREKETFQDRTDYEKAKDFQWGFLLLAFLLFSGLLFLLSKKMQSKDAKSEKILSLKLSPLKLEQPPVPQIEEPVVEDEIDPVVSISDFQESINSYMMKIALITSEIGVGVQTLLRNWMSEGEDGQIRVALVLDSLMTYKESFLQRGVERIVNAEDFIYPIISNYQDGIKEVFSQMSDLELDERNGLLEEVYWELMSLKALGTNSMKRPFDYLDEVSFENVKNLLEGQDEKTASVTLLHLPDSQRNAVLKSFDFDKKKKYIRTLLSNHEILEEELTDMETSVKLSAKSLSSDADNGKINLFPQTTRILKSLSSDEELLMLRQVCSELSDGGENLKRFYPTIAFVDQWREDLIEKICSRLSPAEMTALVNLIPDLQSIISHCPPKVRTIVEDDVRLGIKLSNDKVKNELKGLKRKVNKFLAEENVELINIYAPVESGIQSAA